MKEMDLLSQSDFEIYQSSTGAFARFKRTNEGHVLGDRSNWPFHTDLFDKRKFIQSTGIEIIGSGSFPYTRTIEECTLLLVLAINDYNSRQC